MKCVGVGSPEQLGKANFIVAKTAEFDLGKISSL
jgi:hypothetical protein